MLLIRGQNSHFRIMCARFFLMVRRKVAKFYYSRFDGHVSRICTEQCIFSFRCKYFIVALVVIALLDDIVAIAAVAAVDVVFDGVATSELARRCLLATARTPLYRSPSCVALEKLTICKYLSCSGSEQRRFEYYFFFTNIYNLKVFRTRYAYFSGVRSHTRHTKDRGYVHRKIALSAVIFILCTMYVLRRVHRLGTKTTGMIQNALPLEFCFDRHHHS